jgi:hypothetical protein
MLVMEEEAEPKTLPAGLGDKTLHRHCMHWAKRSILQCADVWFPGEEKKEKRKNFRLQLEQYTSATRNFSQVHATDFWEDSDHNVYERPWEPRPVEVWTLWERPELQCPELQYGMLRLAGCYPQQSAVERANGLIEHTSGNKRRYRMSVHRRQSLALVADRVNREAQDLKEKLSSGTRARRCCIDAFPPSDSEDSMAEDEGDVGCHDIDMHEAPSDDSWSSSSSSTSTSSDDN